MNRYEEMACRLIGEASRYAPTQEIYRELMAAAGTFAVASSIADATGVLGDLSNKIGDAIDREIEAEARRV